MLRIRIRGIIADGIWTFQGLGPRLLHCQATTTRLSKIGQIETIIKGHSKGGKYIITYESGSESLRVRVEAVVAAPSVVLVVLVVLVVVLISLAADVSRSASATDEALLRRRFAVIDLGRSFVSPFEVLSILGNNFFGKIWNRGT